MPVWVNVLLWCCRKAVKATLVLLPLLGITYMLFFVNPGGEDEVARIVFIYFNSILESFQVQTATHTRGSLTQFNRLSERLGVVTEH